MTTDTLIYGVRGPDPRNTVVRATDVRAAAEMLLAGDVLVFSRDDGATWETGRIRVVAGEVRNYESTTCDDCGTGLIMPGWLCQDCFTAESEATS